MMGLLQDLAEFFQGKEAIPLPPNDDEDNVALQLEEECLDGQDMTEANRRRVVKWFTEHIFSYLGHPPEYDTDLLCNLSLTDNGIWRVGANHIFAETQAVEICHVHNRYEDYYLYPYEDVMILASDVVNCFRDEGLPLKATMLFAKTSVYEDSAIKQTTAVDTLTKENGIVLPAHV